MDVLFCIDDEPAQIGYTVLRGNVAGIRAVESGNRTRMEPVRCHGVLAGSAAVSEEGRS